MAMFCRSSERSYGEEDYRVCLIICDEAPTSISGADIENLNDSAKVDIGSVAICTGDGSKYIVGTDRAWHKMNQSGGGYPEPTGSIDIVENGIYNVKDYAEANINVAGTQLVTDKGYPIVALALYDEERADETTCVRYVFNTAVNELVNRRTNLYDDDEGVQARVWDYNDDGSYKRVRFTNAYINGNQYSLVKADEEWSDMFMKINGVLCAFVVPQDYFVPEFNYTNLPPVHRVTFADGDVAVHEEIVPAGGVLTWE